MKLLGAIETNSLVARDPLRLSDGDQRNSDRHRRVASASRFEDRAPPSDLPPAVRIANTCYDRWSHTQLLPAALRDDIDHLAGHFYGQGEFVITFLHLVPWRELEGTPNKGHAAVADLLVSRGVPRRA
ncbi:MAG: hypothetical protein KIS96_00245 [Bauldia sp.]|nr:hypothetical protein [Bauldia sp.]